MNLLQLDVEEANEDDAQRGHQQTGVGEDEHRTVEQEQGKLVEEQFVPGKEVEEELGLVGRPEVDGVRLGGQDENVCKVNNSQITKNELNSTTYLLLLPIKRMNS